jgi:hypothetical protein
MHDVSVSRMPYAKEYCVCAQVMAGRRAADHTGDDAFGGAAPASFAGEL